MFIGHWFRTVLGVAGVATLLSLTAVEAKEPLTFQKVVIADGGRIESPIEIAGDTDLQNAGLDSIRPSVPEPGDLGTAYRLILYPENSTATIDVTYYAPKADYRGYIHQENAVSLGGGTLGPGWNRPSPELETALREHGATNLSGESASFDPGKWIVVLILGATVVFMMGAWLVLRRLQRRGNTQEPRFTAPSHLL